MSDDWQPGDLALCVNTDEPVKIGPSGLRTRLIAGRRFRKGALYTVSRAFMHPTAGKLLWLNEDETGQSAAAWRFRKIRPHAPDAEDRRTIELLNGKPVRELVPCNDDNSPRDA